MFMQKSNKGLKHENNANYCCFACTFLFLQGTARGGTTLDLNALVREGLENNPEITAYRNKAGAMWERASRPRMGGSRTYARRSNLPVPRF